MAGVASSLNYLLSRDAIIDLLNAEKATILVLPARELDETCWAKAAGRARAGADAARRCSSSAASGEGRPATAAWTRRIAGVPGDALDFEPSSDRDTVCALFHTGGTTGRPKLVQLTHGNQIHAAFGFAQVFGYDERDVVINGFPFFHVGGTMTVGLVRARGRRPYRRAVALRAAAAGGHRALLAPRRELRRHRRRRRADLDRRADQQLEAGHRRLDRCGWR